MSSEKLSVLMLSWEFPPRIIGGISSHVNDLSLALTRKGMTVHVVTCDFPEAPEYEKIHGVHVYRFNSKIPSYNFLSWIFSMNQNMAEKAIDVINSQNENIDIIHAHDWLVANAAINVKDAYGKPLVSTMHATEDGRRGGIHSDYQRTISEVERHLVDQSSKVICCSNFMADQISEAFDTPKEKLYVIRNGVDAAKFDVKVDSQSIRRRYVKANEKMVVYVGRLVHEKGVHVLIGAAPKVLSVLPNVNFVIVGEGGMKEYLTKEAWDFGVANHVFFTGFVDEKMLISIYKASDAAVFPSLYEPFGITALEAMAAKTPVVVSDTGGLAEIVEHDKTGVKVYTDNSDSLAWGIIKVLQNQSFANTIREKAYKKVVKCYDWNRIADETIEVYRQAMKTAPAPRLKFDVGIPLIRFDQYPEELRIVVLLHILGAVDSEHAKSAKKLSDMLGMRIEDVQRLLQRLLELGYIVAFRDRLRRLLYYLTKRGIIKACSFFS
ncbi:MAG TPA: glycosyltransferase family 4 protein [Candidatus Bathyarchaeia archaeon]